MQKIRRGLSVCPPGRTAKKYALPYLLTTYSTSGTYLVLGIGLAALLAALLMVLSHLRYRKRQRQAAAAEAEPLSPTSPEAASSPRPELASARARPRPLLRPSSSPATPLTFLRW